MLRLYNDISDFEGEFVVSDSAIRFNFGTTTKVNQEAGSKQ